VYERVGAETDSLTITGSHTPLTILRASLRCPGLGELSPDTGLSKLPGRRRKSHLGRERGRERTVLRLAPCPPAIYPSTFAALSKLRHTAVIISGMTRNALVGFSIRERGLRLTGSRLSAFSHFGACSIVTATINSPSETRDPGHFPVTISGFAGTGRRRGRTWLVNDC